MLEVHQCQLGTAHEMFTSDTCNNLVPPHRVLVIGPPEDASWNSEACKTASSKNGLRCHIIKPVAILSEISDSLNWALWQSATAGVFGDWLHLAPSANVFI